MKKSPLIGITCTCLSLLAPAAFGAATVTGFNDVTIDNSDPANVILTELTYDGATYTADQLIFGTTTRYYNTADATLLWHEGDAVPGDIVAVPGTSNPKVGDVGSHADNNIWKTDAGPDISSIDGLPLQRTVFDEPTQAIFVFERGGNDNGTVQALFEAAGFGEELTLTKGGEPYLLVGNYSGQNDHGYVLESDRPMYGIQINAPGHDSLTIATIPTVVPEPTSLSLLGLGLGGLLLARRRNG